MTDSDLRALYDEELTVAKDAISNLRTSFRFVKMSAFYRPHFST